MGRERVYCSPLASVLSNMEPANNENNEPVNAKITTSNIVPVADLEKAKMTISGPKRGKAKRKAVAGFFEAMRTSFIAKASRGPRSFNVNSFAASLAIPIPWPWVMLDIMWVVLIPARRATSTYTMAAP